MKAHEVELLRGCSAFHNYKEKSNKPYFPGACSTCCKLTTNSEPLKRCAGCQLVAYCGRECQRFNWEKHKPLCKMYPVTNGKNAFTFNDEIKKDEVKWLHALEASQKKVLASGIEKNQFLSSLFSAASRVCNICKEARQDKLFDCSCCCVAYCRKDHQQADKVHKENCTELSMFPNIWWLKIRRETLTLPCGILKNTVQTKFKQIDDNHFDKMKSKLFKEFENNYNGEPYLPPPSSLTRFDLMFAIQTNHLAFPLTILFNLQRFGVGKFGKPVQTVLSLNLHIVAFRPVMDSSGWEYFMHLLPALTELNITFISPQFPDKTREFMDFEGITLERCNDCKTKGRIIKYSIHRNYYHMFFSSDEYTEPDVVAVFGNLTSDVMYTEEEKEHPKISYRNMTYSKDTLLILTDPILPALNDGLQYVVDACPKLEIVLPPTKNPMSGSLGFRGLEQFPVLNFKKFVCCLRKS